MHPSHLLGNGVMWYYPFSPLSYTFSPLHQESMFLVVLCMIMYEMVRAKLVDMKGFLLGYIVLLAITGTNI